MGRLPLVILLWYVAVGAGHMAEVTVLPGLALLAGAMQSRPFQRKVGFVSAVVQGVVVAYFALYMGVGTYIALSESGPRADARAVQQQPDPVPFGKGRFARPVEVRPGPPDGAARQDSRETALLILMGAVGTGFVITLLYTWLQSSLYSAGGRAAVKGDSDA